MYLSNFSVIWLWCDEEIIDPESEPAIYIIAKPIRGSEIATNASITLYFNNAPADLMVSHGTARTSGSTGTVNGPFTIGPLSLTVTWAMAL